MTTAIRASPRSHGTISRPAPGWWIPWSVTHCGYWATCPNSTEAADTGRPVPEVLAAFLDPARMDRFHARGSHGFLFADSAALAHEPALGEAARLVHQHFAQALAELLHRGQIARDIRDDIAPHTAAWWLISLLAGRTFRAAAMPDRDSTEAELTDMTLRSLLPEGQRLPEHP